MTMPSLSIRAKLLLAMMITSLAGLAIVSGALLRHQYGRAGEELLGEMARVADIVAANNLGALQFGDHAAASASLGRLAVDDRVAGAAVYDDDATLFAGYVRPDTTPWPDQATGRGARGGALEVSRPMLLDDEEIGTLVVRVDPSTVGQRFRADVAYLLPLTLVAATIAFVIALVLRRVIASPLLHLAEQAQIVSQRADYSLRVDKRADDEVGTLYERFNEMLGQIERRDLELVAARDALEERVEERTRALSVARDDAESASRAKSAFLANMSHELRTPLNAIIGYSELLLEDEVLEQTDAGPDLRRIQSSGKHLLQLINDVLDLSKVEAGKMDLHLEAVAIGPWVDDLVSAVAPQAAKNGNALVVQCAEDVGTLRTDALKLRQVLLNLLANACKFTHHGTVTLTVSLEPRVNRARTPCASVGAMGNVLDPSKQQQVVALGRLGWSLRRIEQATGVRRETVERLPAHGGRRRCGAGGGRGRMRRSCRAKRRQSRPFRRWGCPPTPRRRDRPARVPACRIAS